MASTVSVAHEGGQVTVVFVSGRGDEEAFSPNLVFPEVYAPDDCSFGSRRLLRSDPGEKATERLCIAWVMAEKDRQ